ncbi:hypothetical protein [Xenorhabdus bovienii]|nr:hypothetical protein [Xenorhabdus bovienii]
MNLETNRIGNAITSFDAVVPAILHKKTLLSSYNPCEYVTVSDSVDDRVVTSDKRICTPPNDNDYVMNDERISDSVRLSLNMNYNGDFFDKKNKPDFIKTVSASELADILKDKPLDNSIIADLINDLLYDAAAQDGYEGITLSDSDYITESEVSDALKTIGGKLTASDLFSPIQDIELPSISTGTGIGTGSGTKIDSDIEIKVDFGSDPNVKLPDLGEPPSGKEIIQPIRDSMPFLSDFKIGGRDAACPVADISFSLAGFNFEQIIDSHCDVIEKNRKFIELIASLIWAFAALRMILSA